MSVDNDLLTKMQNDIFDLIEEWIANEENVTSAVVAAAFMATAMKIYRTTLSDEDFNGMVDMISKSRDLISPLFDTHDKSRLN